MMSARLFSSFCIIAFCASLFFALFILSQENGPGKKEGAREPRYLFSPFFLHSGFLSFSLYVEEVQSHAAAAAQILP